MCTTTTFTSLSVKYIDQANASISFLPKKTQIDVVGVSVFILEIPYHLKTPQSVVNSISSFFPLRPVCLNSVFTTIVHGLISRIYIDVQNIKFSDCCLLFRLLNLNFFGLTIAYFHFNIKLVIRL